MRAFTIFRILAAAMLIWALADNPYSYYQMLRWVVCGVAGYGAFLAMESERKGWALAFGITAILFNPIAPIHLDKETWAFIDISVAVLLLISIPFCKVQINSKG